MRNRKRIRPSFCGKNDRGRKCRREVERGILAGTKAWCGKEDLNLHDLSATRS
jgi:hypothetical protein